MAESRRQRVIAGFVAIAVGVFGLAMMVLHPEGLRTPAWIAYVAMSTFVFAGASLLFREYGAARLGDWTVLVTVLGLFLTGAWISFGPGPRNCTAVMFFISFDAAEWTCRGAFGIGTLLLLVICVLVFRRLLGTNAKSVSDTDAGGRP